MNISEKDKKTIDKNLKEIKEIEERLRNNKPERIEFTPKQSGILLNMDNFELVDWFHKFQEEQSQRANEWQEFLKNNSDMPEQDRLGEYFKVSKFFKAGPLSPEATLKFYEDYLKSGQIFQFLLDSKNTSNQNEGKQQLLERKLFKGVGEDDFAICSILADAMYHLTELLEAKAVTYNDKSTILNSWLFTGTTKDSYGNSITLEYEFQAPSEEDAKKSLEEYKKLMRTNGIRTWMAYWLVATKYGSPTYTCPFIEILECMSSHTRSARFDTEERQRYWNITRVLKKTVIKLSKKVKTRNTEKYRELPLLQILGGEREGEKEYPLEISVKVLDGLFKGKDFAPTIYRKETLKLNPSDMLLAFMAQTRLNQNNFESSSWDWASLFDIGNVQGTSKTRPRDKRSKIKTKMKKFENKNIIGGHKEASNGLTIFSKNKKNNISPA